MRTLVAGDAAGSLGTCSKLLSHGRVIYQITFSDASEKSDFFFLSSPEVNASGTCIYFLSLLGSIDSAAFSLHSFL